MLDRKGALEGLTVLDLTRVLAGPFCTMMLADMGANVIKIEQAGTGADERQMGPFLNGESAYFMNLNRNKKGVTLNLKSSKGKEIFIGLVKNADIVIENYRPGTMEKLGLGYDVLKEINPGIIYAAISGFGHSGPYTKRPGYDIIAQAMSGLMSTTGWPGGQPTRSGTAMGDVLGGLSAAIGILSAVHNRTYTQKGQKVDVALVDSAVASLEIINMIYFTENRLPQRIGNRYESVYPYDSFQAKDDLVIIAGGNDKLWQLFCGVIGRPELADHPEYQRTRDRVKNHVAVKKIVEEWTCSRTVSEIVEQLLATGIPAAPIYTIEQVANDPHIAGAREMFVQTEHPKAGSIKLTGSHIKLSDTKPGIRTPSPALGEHNQEVLSRLLGLTDSDLQALKEEGVI
ncbi:CaiB/BaiF CoA transferase family protein [Sporomusa malonica]|uniref:Formyl-CoA transferase n=1 Tax=Sporomusa malonica TaxID=112901 RepID=A0A1W2D6Q9_9FIRM|nr:CoA transferase [Sporomusa malonica]SMC93240.1 formyl-CoA transferase [Sporomusa malonica]